MEDPEILDGSSSKVYSRGRDDTATAEEITTIEEQRESLTEYTIEAEVILQLNANI